MFWPFLPLWPFVLSYLMSRSAAMKGHFQLTLLVCHSLQIHVQLKSYALLLLLSSFIFLSLSKPFLPFDLPFQPSTFLFCSLPFPVCVYEEGFIGLSGTVR